MYDWNDILIVGDSFCGDRNSQNDWPQLLCCNLSGLPYKKGRKPRGRGFPGASWWSARNCLITEVARSVPKIVILCHTEPFRIPNDDNFGINTLSVEKNTIYVPSDAVRSPSENFRKAALGYYEYLISEDFHLWAYRQWLWDSDKFLSSFSKIEKVVHLFCFDSSVNNFPFKKGITFEDSLHSYQTVPEGTPVSIAPNHYSISDNIVFGNRLAEIIKNYPGDGVRLNTKLIGN